MCRKKTGHGTARTSLSKSDSSSDSGVAEMAPPAKPLAPKGARRKISVVAREAEASPNAEQEVVQCRADPPSNAAADTRQRSFETPALRRKWRCSPKPVWKTTVEAIREFDMIREGDRIAVCLSGGKDSLSLLHTLHQYQYYSQSHGITFTLGAITLHRADAADDSRPLIPYLRALGVQYHLVDVDQPKAAEANAEEKVCSSLCDFSSRVRCCSLFKIAEQNNYNVIALGQHFDDAAESFVVSAFHSGKLHSLKAHYRIGERELRVIRPYIYVREKQLRQFAESSRLPVVNENYSSYLEASKARLVTRQLLAQQEVLLPQLFANLKAALQPLIAGYEIRSQLKNASTKIYNRDESSVFTISDPEEEREADPR